MTELLHQQGFLGTSANFGADITLLLSILVGILFTTGLFLARRGHYEAHRWVQTSAASLNAVLVLWLMILPYRDFVLPGVPARLGESFFGITTLHALAGIPAFFLGIFIVLRANGLVPQRLRFTNYKGFMRVSYSLYMLATILGIWVYFSWFVNNPNPPVYK